MIRTKYKVLNNITLQTDGRTTQIDHVVVSNLGLFVIETKNYKGWIIGDEYSEYWTQVIYKRKEKLYNHIRQNYGHLMALLKSKLRCDMKCPIHKLENPNDAMICDCGYDFLIVEGVVEYKPFSNKLLDKRTGESFTSSTFDRFKERCEKTVYFSVNEEKLMFA